MRSVALLRGVNVGGHRKVPMADLRALFEGLGYEDVQSVLQSGNVVFRGKRAAVATTTATIEKAIEAGFGFPVAVLIRTGEQLAEVIEANPIAKGLKDPSKLHVAFASKPVAKAALTSIDPERFAPDEFVPGKDEIYLWFPNGSGRSKLTIGPFEKVLGAKLTARNWNTVTKLRDLTSD